MLSVKRMLMSCLSEEGADHEAGAIGGVAADEDVVGGLRMLGLEEAHSQQNQLGLEDFGLALLCSHNTMMFPLEDY